MAKETQIPTPYVCPECEESFMNKLANGKYQCQGCKQIFDKSRE